jgi:hypothetical protein
MKDITTSDLKGMKLISLLAAGWVPWGTGDGGTPGRDPAHRNDKPPPTK